MTSILHATTTALAVVDETDQSGSALGAMNSVSSSDALATMMAIAAHHHHESQQSINTAAVATALALFPLTTTLTTILSTQATKLEATQTPSSVTAGILSKHTVQVHDHDLSITLDQLTTLQQALDQHPLSYVGRSPGFTYVANSTDGQGSMGWSTPPASDNASTDTTCYETYDWFPSDRYSIPLPSPQFVARCCDWIRHVLDERREHLASFSLSGEVAATEKCECITAWEHFDKAGNGVAYSLVNQTLEQLMIQQASEVLCQTEGVVEAYNARYTSVVSSPTTTTTATTEEQEPTLSETTNGKAHQLVAHLATPHTPIRVLRHRDVLIETVTRFALASRGTIQISTCYLHAVDPATRYLLMDVLPYCCAVNGVTVQLLVDLLTIEGALIKSAFMDAKKESVAEAAPVAPQDQQAVNAQDNHAASVPIPTRTSFLNHLPTDAPAFCQEQDIESPLEFLQNLMTVAASCKDGRYQVRWWCARDAQAKYRVKNHSKCMVFDEQAAIMGGSNLIPTMTAATMELDLVMAGPVAAHVSASFRSLWELMAEQEEPSEMCSSAPLEPPTHSSSSTTTPNCLLQQVLREQDWVDTDSKVTIVQSQPGLSGEDTIFRVVLGALGAAKIRIRVCMGHCNIPHALAVAFRNATDRGIDVQLICNSFYSNDLRGGQADLFKSLGDLIHLAPKVQVYTTAGSARRRPLFVHAKYVTVDGSWSAVGSWNLWTRSSFYEIEHEAIIESSVIAAELELKFEQDKTSTCVLIETAQACAPGQGFCPKGCYVCKGFGPFFM